MTRSFRHKGLQRFDESGSKAGIQPAHAKRLELILALLQSARTPKGLELPGMRLHQLVGNRQGRWAVSVSGAWRVTFVFEDGHAWEVDYVQYH